VQCDESVQALMWEIRVQPESCLVEVPYAYRS
jgi:hypothetical protein